VKGDGELQSGAQGVGLARQSGVGRALSGHPKCQSVEEYVAAVSSSAGARASSRMGACTAALRNMHAQAGQVRLAAGKAGGQVGAQAGAQASVGTVRYCTYGTAHTAS